MSMPGRPKGVLTRLSQVVALAVLSALVLGATHKLPHVGDHVSSIYSLGFLLLAGTLTSELAEVLRLPHLSGYIAAGLVAGPHVLHLVDHAAVTDLSIVDSLALALIAFAGGAELRLEMFREGLRSLAWAMLLQTVLGFVGLFGVFLLLRKLIPFTSGLPLEKLLAVAALWGVLGISRSPAACLGILSQTRAKGPLTTFSLSFIMVSDVVILVVLALTLAFVRPVLEPGVTLSLEALKALAMELLGSLALGTTLGLLLAAYMRLVGKQIVLVLIALGFGMTNLLKYLHMDVLLVYLAAGFIVQNLSRQGDAFLHAVERTGGVVYVIFFALAGAHLDLPNLKLLWPAAVALSLARIAVTWISARVASSLSHDAPVLRRFGFVGLISQAGVALGIALIVERSFPGFGAGFSSLALATIAINELIGPVFFKAALDAAGETKHEEELRPSLVPASSTAPPSGLASLPRNRCLLDLHDCDQLGFQKRSDLL